MGPIDPMKVRTPSWFWNSSNASLCTGTPVAAALSARVLVDFATLFVLFPPIVAVSPLSLLAVSELAIRWMEVALLAGLRLFVAEEYSDWESYEVDDPVLPWIAETMEGLKL
jgi:hypothetical protein